MKNKQPNKINWVIDLKTYFTKGDIRMAKKKKAHEKMFNITSHLGTAK